MLSRGERNEKEKEELEGKRTTIYTDKINRGRQGMEKEGRRIMGDYGGIMGDGRKHLPAL